ncbi:CopG domain protein DNA-binding domain protein [Ktedonobacter racemifer DSM 44963]|uniref:CopG domain protein DNA-binding domain protein n=2 Tax=Ktedonobacter racemifer TaxID=363277 RepID=D6TG57_KTERA|nr:ribbon-helix-helix domain-containing protein [Ktedonobacter racemifer]EFH88759.1 CopG domain protein DNA-binding domain protein [Ktedonobacter racemifer DSM 44963]
MPKERTNIYITERQKRQLEKRSQEEDLPMAEIIRRALDAYLAWDDPTYQPTPPTHQTRKSHSSPGYITGAFWLVSCKDTERKLISGDRMRT